MPECDAREEYRKFQRATEEAQRSPNPAAFAQENASPWAPEISEADARLQQSQRSKIKKDVDPDRDVPRRSA